MIAGILYTGKYSTIKALSRNCKLTLHRHGQPREDIDTWLHAYSTQVRTVQEIHLHMIARILYKGTGSIIKALSRNCKHTLHRHGQPREDIDTWLHAYSTQVRTVQEIHWHMIARILYKGTGSTIKALSRNCKHTLHRHGQPREDIGTWLHAYSTQVRTAQERQGHMIARILYTGTDNTTKTLAHYSTRVCTTKERHWHMKAHILNPGTDEQHRNDTGTWLHTYSIHARTAKERHYNISLRAMWRIHRSTDSFHAWSRV